MQYVTGCNQALLVPRVKEDGTLAESHWFDEQRLQPTGTSPVVVENGAVRGFDAPAPKR